MSITVETVSPSDRDVWLDMRGQLWPGSSATHARDVDRFFAGHARNPVAALIARDDDGRAIGFAELSFRSYAEGCTTDQVAFLEGWFVIPHARGSGVGRALITGCEEWARAQSCTEFASDAHPDNETTIAAHLALGFTDEGLIRCFSKKL